MLEEKSDLSTQEILILLSRAGCRENSSEEKHDA